MYGRSENVELTQRCYSIYNTRKYIPYSNIILYKLAPVVGHLEAKYLLLWWDLSSNAGNFNQNDRKGYYYICIIKRYYTNVRALLEWAQIIDMSSIQTNMLSN